MSAVSIPFLFILIVGAVIFLAMLGKHGWNPFLKTLLVLAVVFLAYLLVGRPSHQPDPWSFTSPGWAPHNVLEGHGNGLLGQRSVWEQTVRRNVLNAMPGGVSEFNGDGFFGGTRFEAQARPVVRGRWSVLGILVILGLATFVILLLVRRGRWSWPGVLKAGGLVLGIVLVLMVGVRWTRSRVERQQAVEVAMKAHQHATEAPRIRPRETPETAVPGTPGTEAPSKLYRDVEVWQRESVLGFAPFSSHEEPSWSREGRTSQPERVETHGTVFLSSLPEGRDWVVGYSSQDPDIEVAEREALAEARRKLAVEALLQVKRRVPELDVRPLEELAERLAMRYDHGEQEARYVEQATRPYGSVYRAAVRIGAQPREIDSLARRVCRTVDASGSGRPDLQVAFFTGMILVVLAFSAFLVYVFFRAGATGKWAFPLRVLSSLMLAALVAAAVYVSVNLGAL